MKHVAFLHAINMADLKKLYILRRDREKSVFSTNRVEKTPKMLTTTRNLSTSTKIVENTK